MTEGSKKPSRRGCQADRVYREILKRITTGVWGAGVRLIEREIANELNVSRTPVRAAFERLFSEGVLELVPNKGAVVADVSVDDLLEILEIRRALEALTCSLAVSRLSSEEVKELEEILTEMKKAVAENDLYRYSDLNNRFHHILVSASGNRRLAKILETLKTQMVRYRITSLLCPGRVANSIAEHEALVKAVIRSQTENTPKYAEHAVQEHLDGLREAILFAARRDGLFRI